MFVFDENLREVNVSFKTRGGVFVILIELGGGECNFPLLKTCLTLLTSTLEIERQNI